MNYFFLLFLLFSGSIVLSQEIETFEKAQSLFKSGKLEEAKTILQTRIKTQAGTVGDHLLLSHCLYQSGAVNPAIDELYAALKLKPTDPEIYIELIKLHISANRFKGAMDILETAETKFSNSKELKLQKAFLMGKYGKVNTALGIIEELKQEYPNDPRPLSIESNLYFLKGDYEKAEMSIKWAISLQENSPFYHNNLSLIHEKMAETSIKTGNKDQAKNFLLEAEKSIQKAISIRSLPQMLETQKRIQGSLAGF